MDGTGVFAISGTGTVTLPAAVIDGTGAIVPELTATGALVLGGVVIDGVAENGDYVPVIPPVGRRRQKPIVQQQQAFTATGSLVLPSVSVAGAARSEYDDLWLYLEPALYLAGVT
jgi:hypothetical protein